MALPVSPGLSRCFQQGDLLGCPPRPGLEAPRLPPCGLHPREAPRHLRLQAGASRPTWPGDGRAGPSQGSSGGGGRHAALCPSRARRPSAGRGGVFVPSRGWGCGSNNSEAGAEAPAFGRQTLTWAPAGVAGLSLPPVHQSCEHFPRLVRFGLVKPCWFSRGSGGSPFCPRGVRRFRSGTCPRPWGPGAVRPDPPHTCWAG